MKKIILLAAVAIMTAMSVQAQKNQPTNVRMEVTSVEQNDNEYELFTYKDEDGSINYYLSLGRVTRIMDVFFDPELAPFSLDHIDETCLCLGDTFDKAYDMLGDLLDFCDKDLGSSKDYPTRVSLGQKLGDPATISCQVVKKALGGKRLEFFFADGAFTTQLRLTKSAIKQLRWAFKLDKKLHPKQHL